MPNSVQNRRLVPNRRTALFISSDLCTTHCHTGGSDTTGMTITTTDERLNCDSLRPVSRGWNCESKLCADPLGSELECVAHPIEPRMSHARFESIAALSCFSLQRQHVSWKRVFVNLLGMSSTSDHLPSCRVATRSARTRALCAGLCGAGLLVLCLAVLLVIFPTINCVYTRV